MTMITIIGTGHIFNISEQVAFIIKHVWPDAVLVELDESRFEAMNDPDAKIVQMSKTYKKAAEYQKKMAAEYDTVSGAELITAVNAGRMIGADVHFIDKNAANVMERVWNEMPFSEKLRYRISGIKDTFSKKEKIETTLEEFSENEEKYIENMRRKFPTFVRILIDERNEHMAGRIREVSEKYENMVAVIGDGHVEAVSKMIGSLNVKKIRLKDLMNRERMDAIRSKLWTHKGETDDEG